MAEFTISRSTNVRAEPARVHQHVDDFRAWQQWSPWEGIDPDMTREYSGPDRGVGATYRWSGNKKAGEGMMRITSSTPTSVVADLEFLKPFKASNVMSMAFTPTDGGEATEVTWTMTGKRNPVMGLLGKLFFDKSVAADFDKGLSRLKAVSEQS